MKISARNKLEGKVVSVEQGKVAAIVKVEITSPGTLTAMITAESVDDMGIKKGDKVSVVIKSTEVMIAKE